MSLRFKWFPALLLGVGVAAAAVWGWSGNSPAEEKIIALYDQHSSEEVSYYVFQADSILKINRREDEFGKTKGRMWIATNVDVAKNREWVERFERCGTPPPYVPGGPHYSLSIYAEGKEAVFGSVSPESQETAAGFIEFIGTNRFVPIEKMPPVGNERVKKTAEWVWLGSRG